VTQPLSADRKLISQNGSFALGFFQPTGSPGRPSTFPTTTLSVYSAAQCMGTPFWTFW